MELNHNHNQEKKQPAKCLLLVAFLMATCHTFAMELREVFEAINSPDLEPNSDLAVLREVLRSVAYKKNFDTQTMKKFGELTGKAHQHRRLKPSATEVGFELVGLTGGVRKIAELALIVEDILVTSELDRIKECAGEDCDQLFVDESKNKSKKWCDMAHCGMLHKSKTFYDRHRRVSTLPESNSKIGARLR